MSDFCLDK